MGGKKIAPGLPGKKFVPAEKEMREVREKEKG